MEVDADYVPPGATSGIIKCKSQLHDIIDVEEVTKQSVDHRADKQMFLRRIEDLESAISTVNEQKAVLKTYTRKKPSSEDIIWDDV
jgi:hypothetical protein